MVLYPRVVLEGSGFWATCYVPRSFERAEAEKLKAQGVELPRGQALLRIRMDLPTTFMTRDIHQVEHKRLVERAPCGTHVIRCSVASYVSDTSWVREEAITVRGQCNAEDGGL